MRYIFEARYYIFLICLSLLGLTNSLNAQFLLKGKILEMGSNKSIPDCIVDVNEAQIKSNNNGEFEISFKKIDSEKYYLNIYKEGFYRFANFPLDHWHRMIISDEIYEYYVKRFKKEEDADKKIFTMTGESSYEITYPNPLSLLELAFKKVVETGSLKGSLEEPIYISILPYHLQERYKLESFRYYLRDV